MAYFFQLDAVLVAHLALAVVGTAVLVGAWHAVRGTTLRAPCAWSLLAFAFLVFSEGYELAGGSSKWSSTFRWTAAGLALCPTVALLGAKRPQNRAWQWIVASLAVVVALPMFESFGQARAAADVHWLRAGFMLLLTLVGAGNYLPTRYRWAACCGAGAQAVLVFRLAGFMPEAEVPLATLLAVAGLLLANRASRRTQRSGVQRLWTDFRDAYGLAWGMRVAERLSVAAKVHHWPLRWSWYGPEQCSEQEVSVAVQGKDYQVAHDRMLSALLLRFVSPQWIASRPIDTRSSSD